MYLSREFAADVVKESNAGGLEVLEGMHVCHGSVRFFSRVEGGEGGERRQKSRFFWCEILKISAGAEKVRGYRWLAIVSFHFNVPRMPRVMAMGLGNFVFFYGLKCKIVIGYVTAAASYVGRF